MAFCERCDLDERMCTHRPPAPGAQRTRAASRPTSRPGRSNNREWEGETLVARDYLRQPQHRGYYLDIEIHNAWYTCTHCYCTDCPIEAEWDPPTDDIVLCALRDYSRVALWATASDLGERYPPHGAYVATAEDWLDSLRRKHAAALTEEEARRGQDDAARDRMRSGATSSWRRGRSPGYYSR